MDKPYKTTPQLLAAMHIFTRCVIYWRDLPAHCKTPEYREAFQKNMTDRLELMPNASLTKIVGETLTHEYPGQIPDFEFPGRPDNKKAAHDSNHETA